nr:hypothetical protein [Tanacetum cinerariifolium]
MCDMVSQLIQKKEEEKKIEEAQAANARYQKIPACYDDDDDYNFAITPNEPVNSLSMGDEHPDTIPKTESDEFIKSSVENLVPILSEYEGEPECDVPVCEEFTTFSNILFDAEYGFDSSDDQSYPHHHNTESDLIESLRTHDSSLIISSKIDFLLNEFADELTLLKSISSGIDETDCDSEEEIRFIERLLYDNSSPPDCDPEEEIRLIEKLLYDNSSPRPLEEFNSENSDAIIESFSPSLILVEDIDSLMEEIDLFLTPDDSMPPGNEDDDYDSEGDILFLDNCLEMIPLHFLNMSHFILMFHHPLVLLRNRRVMEFTLSPIREF